VQDIRMSESAKLAHVVLPATHFGEKDGTYTNRKARVQKLNAALIPPEGAMQDCDIFLRLLELVGEKLPYKTAEQVFEALAKQFPPYQGLSHATSGDLGIDLQAGSESGGAAGS